MYKNIGKKIKAFAVIVTVILMLASVVGGLILIVQGIDIVDYHEETGLSLILFGIASIIVGCLVAWISSFVLYGYGQLVDNTDKMVKLLENGAMPIAPAPVYEAPVAPVVPETPVVPVVPEAPTAAPEAGTCFCINCGNKVSTNVVFCPKCGNKM